jgi:hypothetical protein
VILPSAHGARIRRLKWRDPRFRRLVPKQARILDCVARDLAFISPFHGGRAACPVVLSSQDIAEMRAAHCAGRGEFAQNSPVGGAGR